MRKGASERNSRSVMGAASRATMGKTVASCEHTQVQRNSSGNTLLDSVGSLSLGSSQLRSGELGHLDCVMVSISIMWMGLY